MGKKREEKEQEKRATRFKGVEVGTGDLLENVRSKLIFLADCVSSGSFELTDDGRDGLYWTLHDIAKDIENAISEPVTP